MGFTERLRWKYPTFLTKKSSLIQVVKSCYGILLAIISVNQLKSQLSTFFTDYLIIHFETAISEIQF
jgi:hypothetical protein